MSDYNKLSYDELVQINEELRYKIADLKNFKKQQEEYEKCVARVNPPTKSYKELEEKLANFEEEKQKEINLLKAENYKISNMLSVSEQKLSDKLWNNMELKQRNTDLEKVIETQNMVINLAAGYISSCEQFRSLHPIEVKKWLMGGME